MKLLFFHSTWGLEVIPRPQDQLEEIKAGGFDGVEMPVPETVRECRERRRQLDDLGLAVIAQQCRSSGRTAAEHTEGWESLYERAALLRPLHLNSHTGRDHFTREENLKIFDCAAALAGRHGLEVYHETHRGRALFSAPAAEELLGARPGLKLVADYSHWCCTHESLLEDQTERVRLAARHAFAIHARIGHAQGPQVPDPRDPLWQAHREKHLGWWHEIVACRQAEGCRVLAITPEFGPAPYMTLQPYSGQPLADLWEVNGFMRDWVREGLRVSSLGASHDEENP